MSGNEFHLKISFKGVCNWPKGRVLGGTSVLNFLIYTRGNRRDYDNWAQLGNYGWSYNEVLPYFKKTENVKIPSLRRSPYRGTKGYVDIEQSQFVSKLHRSFIDAGHELGYSENDPNGENQLGFSLAQATMRNGRRCSAAKAYLRPIAKRENLHISMKSWVTRIIIDPFTKAAIGVEFVKNKKRYQIKARKEVIVSAGTIGSAQLLLLSGVGPREDLERLNIPVHSNLKVGYNLQDHVSLSGLTFLVNQPVTVVEHEVRRRPRYFIDYTLFNRGPLTLPAGAEGIAFVKTNISFMPADYPDIELVMGLGSFTGDESGFLRNVFGIPKSFVDKVFGSVRGRHAFTIAPVLMRPKSRGQISLKSTNPFHWPHLRPNFYSNKDDLLILREGIKMALRVGESEAFRRFGTRFHTVPFVGCEGYRFRSDDYWDCCIRRMASSLQHQVGTCKMGVDSDAVVDPHLKGREKKSIF